MMFVYLYVIIPFHLQYLPRHAPQGGGIQRGGIRWLKTYKFSLLSSILWLLKRFKWPYLDVILLTKSYAYIAAYFASTTYTTCTYHSIVVEKNLHDEFFLFGEKIVMICYGGDINLTSYLTRKQLNVHLHKAKFEVHSIFKLPIPIKCSNPLKS